MSIGLSALPRYSYDPRTQQYVRLNPAPMTPEQEANAARRLEMMNYQDTGGAAPQGTPGSGVPGAGGGIGGFGLGLMSLAENVPGIATTIGGVVGQGLTSMAIDQETNAMAQLAALNEQAIESKSDIGPMGVTVSPTSDVSVSPVADPAAVDVSAISGLAAMNEAQQAEAEAATSPAAVAASVADAVASDPGAAAAAADAAADAAGAADSGGSGGDGGPGDSGGGDSGGGDSGAGDGSAGAADGGPGEKAGGVIKLDKYAFGGSVMGMGDAQPRYAYAPIMMSSGGLPAAARKLQEQGRGDDSMLVHMTPGEVKGLQALAMANGGSLSINPETGLPEAGFLKNILPMIAGAALTATGVGAPMAALMVGGGTALFSGSLEKGLMAGLGAFGGAGLGSALSAAGATAPAVTGTTAGLASQGAAGAQAAQAAQTATGAFDMGQGLSAMSGGAGTVVTPSFSGMAQGVKALAEPAGRTAFMQSVGGPMGLAKTAGAAAAPMLFSAEEPNTGKKPQEYIRPYAYDVNRQDTSPEFQYRTGKPGESTSELTYFTPKFSPLGVFKAGTEPGGSFYGTPTAADYELYSKPKGLAAGGPVAFAKGGMEDGAFVIPADVVSHLGNGSNDAGQKILARGLGAKPIKGKGDGMSDSIPTMIAGKRPARVADGEAYVPASVVKKVGAKRLYAMMDKIRRARTGKEQQAPEINPRKFLPT